MHAVLAVSCLCFAPVCRLLRTCPDGSSVAYHIETLPHSLLYDLALDPLEQYVFSTGQDGLLRQWDVASGALQRTLTPEAGAGEEQQKGVDAAGICAVQLSPPDCLVRPAAFTVVPAL